MLLIIFTHLTQQSCIKKNNLNSVKEKKVSTLVAVLIITLVIVIIQSIVLMLLKDDLSMRGGDSLVTELCLTNSKFL